MASNYANSLKKGLDPGPCGQPEIHETERAVKAKVQVLARMIESSERIVLHTGAGMEESLRIGSKRRLSYRQASGISTSCGIPDFRGPNGVWTIQKRIKALEAASKRAVQKGQSIPMPPPKKESEVNRGTNTNGERSARKRKREATSPLTASESSRSSDSIEETPMRKRVKVKDEVANGAEAEPRSDREVSWEDAIPSTTHMAIMALAKKGVVEYIVTQNVDGLHIKSGISPDVMSELHGNVFKEKCDKCYSSAFLEYDLKSLGLKRTGRRCQQPSCSGWMCDAMVDWDQALPDDELDRAEEHSDLADLSICIGTSLRVSPANELPVYAKSSLRSARALPIPASELVFSAS